MDHFESDAELASILELARKAKVIIRVIGNDSSFKVITQDKSTRKGVDGVELRNRFHKLRIKGEIK